MLSAVNWPLDVDEDVRETLGAQTEASSVATPCMHFTVVMGKMLGCDNG